MRTVLDSGALRTGLRLTLPSTARASYSFSFMDLVYLCPLRGPFVTGSLAERKGLFQSLVRDGEVKRRTIAKFGLDPNATAMA